MTLAQLAESLQFPLPRLQLLSRLVRAPGATGYDHEELKEIILLLSLDDWLRVALGESPDIRLSLLQECWLAISAHLQVLRQCLRAVATVPAFRLGIADQRYAAWPRLNRECAPWYDTQQCVDCAELPALPLSTWSIDLNVLYQRASQMLAARKDSPDAVQPSGTA